MKDLKYLFSNNQLDITLQTDRNNVIYLLSKVLNSLINGYPNLIPHREINYIYITITNAIMWGKSEFLHTMVSFLFQLCDVYPMQTLEVLHKTFYSVIEEERKEEIEKASLSIKYYLLAVKNVIMTVSLFVSKVSWYFELEVGTNCFLGIIVQTKNSSLDYLKWNKKSFFPNYY